MSARTLPSVASALQPPAGVELHLLDVHGPPSDADRSTLSADEQERGSRFRRDRDRERFVTTRAALRRLLGRRLGLDPTEVVFADLGRGKPVLGGGAASSGVQFSVAHVGGHAAIALANRPVGVDVEVVRSDTWDLAMAALVLSHAELGYVREHDDPDLAFFRCWTRKEAYVKLGADGLVDELRGLTLTPLPAPGVANGVLLLDALVAPRVVVALAVGSPDGEVEP